MSDESNNSETTLPISSFVAYETDASGRPLVVATVKTLPTGECKADINIEKADGERNGELYMQKFMNSLANLLQQLELRFKRN